MKKQLLFLLMVTFSTMTMWAQSFTSGNLNYNVMSTNPNTVAVVSYETKPSGQLVIPATVSYNDEDYSVTGFIYGLALYGCTEVTSIVLPSTMSDIYSTEVFYCCENLESITVDADNASYSTKDGVLFNKAGTELIVYPRAKPDESYTIPDGVTTIGWCSITGCSKLKSLNIPASVETIDYGSLNSCPSLTSVTVDAGNANYSSKDGVLFNKAGTELITYPAGKSGASYTIPDGVTTINSDAFQDCTNLTSLTIPASVTTIGEYAFGSEETISNITDIYCYADPSQSSWNYFAFVFFKKNKSTKCHVKDASAWQQKFGDLNLTFVGDLDEIDAIDAVTPSFSKGDGAWYTLSGMKLEGEPTEKGIYVKDGKKVLLK